MKSALNPCRFCGSPAILTEDEGVRYFDKNGDVQYTNCTYVISCRFCFARTGSYKRLTDAIAAWNKRASEQDE